MINTTDKITRALYLARSDNREIMLTGLIENVLYQWDEPLSVRDIIQLIKDEFQLTPVGYEIQLCIDSLISLNSIKVLDGRYYLSDETKSKLYEAVIINRDKELARKKHFFEICIELSENTLSPLELKILWEVFNQYILNSFLEFGRKAIDFFISTNVDYKDFANNFLREISTSLSDNRLYDLFKVIIGVYPKKLTHDELRFLHELATKAEYFYSLGVDKESYEKIQDFKINNVTVLVDTNFLYSVLDLHIHKDNEAVRYILELAEKKIIDIDLRYLKITFFELKKAEGELLQSIDKAITSPKHIRVLINSGELDVNAQKYFQEKLVNSSIPHPSEKVKNAIHILKHKGIQSYTAEFRHLDEEDQRFMDARINAYYDYMSKLNSWREQSGYRVVKQKHEDQIYHDVYLREAIVYLRKRQVSQQLKYIGLTLDNSLTKYDNYELGLSSIKRNEVITPIFFSPAIFLKKIRPFIPLETDDYAKAFLSSVTANTFNTEDRNKSIVIQKSISYFKALGIDDEETIMSIITQDVFGEEFEKSIQEGNVEDFISSEINKKIQALKEEKGIINDELISTKYKLTEELNSVNEKAAEIVSTKDQELKIIEKEFKQIKNEDQFLIRKISEEKEFFEQELIAVKAEKEKIEREKNEKENDDRTKKRNAYIKGRVFRWRLIAWMEMLLCIIALLLCILYILYINDFNLIQASENIKKMHTNFIFALLLFLASLYINNVVVKSLVDKYRNHSNIKSFKESIEIPLEFRNVP